MMRGSEKSDLFRGLCLELYTEVLGQRETKPLLLSPSLEEGPFFDWSAKTDAFF